MKTAQDVMIGRKFHESSLLGAISNTGVHNTIMFVLILLPSATVTMYCMIRVWQLRRSTVVGPGVMAKWHNQSTPVQQASKILKMMLFAFRNIVGNHSASFCSTDHHLYVWLYMGRSGQQTLHWTIHSDKINSVHSLFHFVNCQPCNLLLQQKGSEVCYEQTSSREQEY